MIDLIAKTTGVNPALVKWGGLSFLLLSLLYGSYSHGRKIERAEWVEKERDAIVEAVEDANEDAETIREIEIQTVEKIQYVDRVVFKTQTKTIQAECPDGATELTGLFNILTDEINTQLPIHSN